MNEKDIVIFGAGGAGHSALELLKKSYNVVAFFDNNKSLHGSDLSGKMILPPDKLKEYEGMKIYIASEYYEQIYMQLTEELLVDKNRIHFLPAHVIKRFNMGESDSVKKFSEDVLFLICHKFNSSGVRYFVDAGTLLGITRDKELIPWDDDLDFAILSEDTDKAFEIIESILVYLEKISGVEWVLNKEFSSNAFGNIPKNGLRGYKLESVESSVEHLKVDFFINYINNGYMDYAISSRGYRRDPVYMIKRHSTMFKGKEVYVPYDAESYLEEHYGDWKVPKKDWNLSMLKDAIVF